MTSIGRWCGQGHHAGDRPSGRTPRLAGLGVYRWVAEQAFALLHWFRRLRIRWEVRDDIHEAFLKLACAIGCFRRLTKIAV